MPVTDKLMKLLQAPMVLLPLGQASDRQNLPNERVRLRNLTKGAYQPKGVPGSVSRSHRHAGCG
jgi:hypothetical protein